MTSEQKVRHKLRIADLIEVELCGFTDTELAEAMPLAFDPPEVATLADTHTRLSSATAWIRKQLVRMWRLEKDENGHDSKRLMPPEEWDWAFHVGLLSGPGAVKILGLLCFRGPGKIQILDLE